LDQADLEEGAVAPPGAPEVLDMLDPKEQNKGGFGAFAARERERRDTAQPSADAAGGATVPGPDTAPASGDTAAAPAPTARRRRFFGFLLP
jgi:hypothetical protein